MSTALAVGRGSRRTAPRPSGTAAPEVRVPGASVEEARRAAERAVLALRRMGVRDPRLLEAAARRAARDYPLLEFVVPPTRPQRGRRVSPKYVESLAEAVRRVAETLRRLPPEERRRYVEQVVIASALRGTGKTGSIPTLGLPAYLACPGRSGLCLAYCYAAKGYYMRCGVLEPRVLMMLAFLIPGFGRRLGKILAERLARKGIRFYRLHDSGDIWSLRQALDYMRSVLGIEDPEALIRELLGVDVSRLPDDIYVRQLADLVEELGRKGITVYTHTRSWRVPKLWESIEKHLLSKPNFILYLSVDKTMSPEEVERAIEIAKTHPRVRLAFTGWWPEELLRRHGLRAVVCPEEAARIARAAGREAPEVTCARCLICPTGRAHVIFPVH